MYKQSIVFAIVLLQCFLFQTGTAGDVDINLGISDFQCPVGKSISPHPEKCELYYTCYGGQPTYLWQCKSNHLFDTTYDGCNWPDSTYCGNRTKPDQKSTTLVYSTTPAPMTTLKPYTCPEDGFFASDPDRCIQSFYTCLDGFPFSTNCPSYGVFEPVGRKCVSPSNSACKTAVLSTTRAPESPSTTSQLSSTTKSPVTGTTTTSAPLTTRSTAAPVPSSTPSGGTFVCPGNGNYPDPTSCSHYYSCDNGVAYRFACPSGLLFNPATGVCDWPSNVPSCKTTR